MGFDPVSNKVVFPDLESEILDYWKINDTFKKSIEIRKNSPLFSFYEGPPTANGTPGVHHVLSRVFKDIVPRFKTMQGFNVPRKGGWDTHGLPVELAVETELDLHSKTEIEQYGVEKFNEKCRESVFRYVKEWEMLSDRIGFWVDMDDPYVTFKNDYIESGWWIFKELWNKNLIYKDYKVTPHCPRCVTSLSSHEVALGYKEDTEDPSVYIKFLLKENEASNKLSELKSKIPTSLLVWTTTPWTLPANVAIAVSKESKYIIIEGTFSESSEPERLILAEELAKNVINESYKIIGTIDGQDLIGIEYEPLYALSDPKDNPYRVVPADFVSLSDGTGLVHIAPAYGAEDLNVGRTENLPIIHVVDLNGAIEEFNDGPQEGLFFKESDPLITEHLMEKGRLLRSEKIEHTYPFCWRCDAPLLYYAKESWYIKTTQLKDRLIETNRDINWHPEHIRDGRFGEWLENNVDWALSRERFWGTPIPVWVCKDCNHQAAIGSLEELKSQGNLKGFQEDLDLHRPFVDDVTFSCENCGGTSNRVPEVMDAWFDSGAMPVAQLHYPFEGKEDFELQAPADYVCEGVDQTRGWFYTLHALSVLLFDRPAYKNVVSLGHILDETGAKMSKSKGNIVEPWSVLDSRGADALRWYMYTATTPGNPRRFSENLVGDSVRRFLLPLWNTYSFFVTYANLDEFDPNENNAPKISERPLLDKWLISSLNSLISSTTEHLENYRITEGAREIESFVDQLSTWYVRRSRRRFWKSEDDIDKKSAYYTLHECLITLSKLLAPFTPFIAEKMYLNLSREENASVHLDDWPISIHDHIDPKIENDVKLAMQLSSLGRAARSKAKIKVRQPLSKAYALVRSKDDIESLPRIEDQLKDELNVKSVQNSEDPNLFINSYIRPNLSILGPKLGKELQGFISILSSLEETERSTIANKILSGSPVTINDDQYSSDELIVQQEDKEGYVSAQEGNILVVIETTISDDLALEGFARDLVRQIQEMRRKADLDIEDRILLSISGEKQVEKVITNHSGYIEQETLAIIIEDDTEYSPDLSETVHINGIDVSISVTKRSN